MIAFKQLLVPTTLEEAWQLNQKKSSIVLGGMMWLKMQNNQAMSAIDLSALHLDQIEDQEDQWLLGAYVTLSDLIHHEKLNELADGTFQKALQPIVGVQFQNLATIGGSVFGKYGFSDVICLLQALDAKVHLYGKDPMPIQEFVDAKRERDLLTHISIPKKERKTWYGYIRNQVTDFPVLNCAVSKSEDEIRIAVGARPGTARVLTCSAEKVSSPEGKEALMKELQETMVMASNARASKEYRGKMMEVLVNRGLKEVLA